MYGLALYYGYLRSINVFCLVDAVDGNWAVFFKAYLSACVHVYFTKYCGVPDTSSFNLASVELLLVTLHCNQIIIIGNLIVSIFIFHICSFIIIKASAALVKLDSSAIVDM